FQVILILSLIAPKQFDISRSLVIDRPKSQVFEALRSLKRQNQWSPWALRDPHMESSFSGVDGQVGATNYWRGNKKVGEGEQEITRIIDGERIETELRFLKPFKSTSKARLTVEEVGPDSTKVEGGFSGTYKFPMGIMALIMG